MYFWFNCAMRRAGSAGIVTLLSSPSPVSLLLSRRNLMRAAALLPALTAFVAARAQTAPKPDSTTDMAEALKPGPLPELSIGDAAGVPVIEYGSAPCPHFAPFAHDILARIQK